MLTRWKNKYLILVLSMIVLNAYAQDDSFDTKNDPKPFWDHSIQLSGGLFQPLGVHKNLLKTSPGGSLKYYYNPKFFDYFTLNANLDFYHGYFVKNQSSNWWYDFVFLGFGANYEIYPFSFFKDFTIVPSVNSGFYFLSVPNNAQLDAYKNIFLRLETTFKYQLIENLQLGLGVNYNYCYDSKEPIKSLNYLLSLQYNFGSRLKYKGLVVQNSEMAPIFANNFAQYIKYYTSIDLKNNEDEYITDVSVSVKINHYSFDSQGDVEFPSIAPGQKVSVKTRLKLDPAKLELIKADDINMLDITLKYKLNKKKQEKIDHIPVKTYSINQIPNKLSNPAILGFYSTYNNGSISKLASSAFIDGLPFEKSINQAYSVFYLLKALNVSYIEAPKNNIQKLLFPMQTLLKGSGDCGDLSILFVSLLESIGIPCAYVILPDHIFFMFSIENPIPYSVEHNGTYYIPVDATLIQDNFFNAWKKGLDYYKNYNKKMIITAKKAITEFPPYHFKTEERIFNPAPNEIAVNDVSLYRKILPADFNTLVEIGYNFMMKKNYPTAEIYYLECFQKNPKHRGVLDSLIRIYYELDRPAEAEKYLNQYYDSAGTFVQDWRKKIQDKMNKIKE